MAEWPGLPAGYDLPLVNSSTKRLPDPTMDAIEQALIPTFGADAISNPETDMNNAVVTIVNDALAGFSPGDVPRQLFIGDSLSTARPDWDGPIYWVTTASPSSTPTNVQPGDQVFYVDTEPLPPEVIWSDNFNRADGAAGNTAVGNFPWTYHGTGTPVPTIYSNAMGLNPVTGSGVMVVDSGASDGILSVTLPVVDVGNTGVIWRCTDNNNYFLLTRTGSGNLTYQILRRTAGSNTTVAGLTGFTMTAGDDIVVTLDGSSITVEINGVEAWSGTDSNHLTADKHGVYNGNNSALRYDDMSFTTLGG